MKTAKSKCVEYCRRKWYKETDKSDQGATDLSGNAFERLRQRLGTKQNW